MINRITLLLFLFIIACAPVATNKRNLIVEGIKANGQQPEVIDQQPALTNQPNMSEEMINKTNQLLQETRAKSIVAGQSQQQKPQYDNIYQAIANSTPQQLMEMKGYAAKQQGRKEIIRNVGSERGAQLISLIDSGQMSLKQALNRSKNELSPVMRLIDDAYFKKGATTKDLLIIKERLKNSWTQAERNKWKSLYTTLDNKEIAEKHTSTKIYDADKVALELNKYKKMLDDGLISQEDYDAKKNKLLGL